MEKTNDVIGLGNTLMDFLVEVDDNKLLEFDLEKGGMHLVEEEKAKAILKKIQDHQLKIELVPGGSVANTIRALGLLGAQVILCGKVGNDSHGEIYVEQIGNHGVSTRLTGHKKATGHAVTFITPDSERTFSVHLGAALELEKEDILEEDIAKSKVLHLEGYQLEGKTKETILHAIDLAKKHGTKVSLDLSDGGVIRRNPQLIKEVVEKHIDIVFANEIEAEDFTGRIEAEAAEELGKYCEIAIVKIGELGSFIRHNNKTVKVRAFGANAIDTTGAGDTYSAGFLYGYCNNWNLEKSAKLGSLLASKIVEQKGVNFKEVDVHHIRMEVENIETAAESGPEKIKIGVIGGSGLDNPAILQNPQDIQQTTKYGSPSSQLKSGTIAGVEVVLLARHGREHTIPPTQVNNRANIQALKEIGCTHIIATTAVGSLREQIGRGDFVILDQFIDFTRHRKNSFHEEFEPHKPIHTGMAEPFDLLLRKVLTESCSTLELKHFPRGTVITIEGPRFSTKAESKMFRMWGADVINMSIAPEAALANEAGIPYAAVAMSTDYDCWKEDEEPVTWEAILQTFKENVEKVTQLLTHCIAILGDNQGVKEGYSEGNDNREKDGSQATY